MHEKHHGATESHPNPLKVRMQLVDLNGEVGLRTQPIGNP